MRKLTIALLIVFALTIGATPLDVTVGVSIPIYMMRGNIFSECFKEPIETLILIAYNGNFYAFTNLRESSVTMIYEEFEYILEEDGLETKDLMCAIHNHTGNEPTFSIKDIQFYSFLRAEGFKGLFLLWSSPRQRVTDIRYGGAP